MKPMYALIAVVALAVTEAAVAAVREERARGGESPAPAPSPDLEALLWAIRQVETGDNPRRVGSLGERSAYQFMRATWEQHTRWRFELNAQNPTIADEVARRHARWIFREMERQRMGTEVIFFAAAWHYGASVMARHARSDYARRVDALYRDRVAQTRKISEP